MTVTPRATIRDAKCILVVGATAGIGRALALAIHDLPSRPTVIAAGRRQERLDELAQTGDRVKTARVDLTSGRAALKQFVDEMLATYPDLDAVVLSSGIQHIFDFKQPEQKFDLDLFEDEYTTNYVATVTLIKFFLPHFLKLSEQGRPSFLMPITSGLGIVPGPWVPTYSATKAALHSLALSLNHQLKDTKVQVMEIMPPLTESELHDHQGMTPKLSKFWLPLDEFTEQTMAGLCRGDVQVCPGDTQDKWDKFEKGKIELMAVNRT
ncbi:NAD(P)-binding protein [Phanerochaete sordida]|uniref:NAD(P)-binding protein n=1 Tax=Phanerochaete sordida TaxID=48140 RepID=A0A9P3G035_9APHY|nr:NAD(P)-binding protein [Phanerochaete sordida]